MKKRTHLASPKGPAGSRLVALFCETKPISQKWFVDISLGPVSWSEKTKPFRARTGFFLFCKTKPTSEAVDDMSFNIGGAGIQPAEAFSAARRRYHFAMSVPRPSKAEGLSGCS
jgi:hypothetical protein